MSIDAPTPSVFVLGLHYGGTSLVSAIIEAFGFDMGPTDDPNNHHPWGNKEDLDFLNWAMRLNAGQDHYPRPTPTTEELAELRDLIHSRAARAIPWGV